MNRILESDAGYSVIEQEMRRLVDEITGSLYRCRDLNILPIDAIAYAHLLLIWTEQLHSMAIAYSKGYVNVWRGLFQEIAVRMERPLDPEVVTVLSALDDLAKHTEFDRSFDAIKAECDMRFQ